MKKYNYSDEIANVVKKFLTDDDWHYSFDEEKGVFTFGMHLGGKLQSISYRARVKEDALVVYGICPVGANREDGTMMAQMAELLCHANYGMLNGCFEFDFRDGEVRFKSFVDCEGVIPSGDVVKNSIICTASMYKRYGDGIVSIIFGGASAKEAIAMCKKSSEAVLRSMLEGMSSDDVGEIMAQLRQMLGMTGGNAAPAAPAEEDDEICTELFETTNTEVE